MSPFSRNNHFAFRRGQFSLRSEIGSGETSFEKRLLRLMRGWLIIHQFLISLLLCKAVIVYVLVKQLLAYLDSSFYPLRSGVPPDLGI